MTVPQLRGFSESSGTPSQQALVAAPHHVLGDLIWSPSRAARLLRRAAVSVVFLFGLWVELTHPIASLQQPIVYRKDFLQDYLLTRAIVERTDPYLATPVLMERFLGPLPVSLFPLPTPHPPTLGLLLLPLAFLDYPTAATVWLTLETVSLVASVYLLGRIAGSRPGGQAILVSAVIALVWYPVTLDLMLGQFMLPILLLLLGAQRNLQSGRRILGGTLIGVSILLKPIAWPVLLMFLVRKDWRPVAAALAATLVGYAAAVGAIGFGGVSAYLTRVLPSADGVYHAAYLNISAWTVGWRVFDGMGSPAMPDISAPPLVQSPPAAAVVSVALPALILLASLIVIRKRSEATSFGLMVCVSILVSPISWAHYLVLAAIPAVEVGAWLIHHNLPSRETNAALLVATMLLMGDPSGDEWTRLAFIVGETTTPRGTVLLPFAPALFTLGPAVAVAALAALLVKLPDLPSRTLDSKSATLGRDCRRGYKISP